MKIQLILTIHFPRAVNFLGRVCTIQSQAPDQIQYIALSAVYGVNRAAICLIVAQPSV